jgi:DNA-binding NarL/FixJ family response regulator
MENPIKNRCRGVEMNSIKVLLADAQRLFLEGMRTLLAAHPDVEIVGEATNGADAVRLVARLQPHVALMDLNLPVMDGIAATRRLRAEGPFCQVVLLTTFQDSEKVFAGLRAGAVGYLLKDSPSDLVLEAIRAAARGESLMTPSIAAKVIAEFVRIGPRVQPIGLPEPEQLSARETEVISMLAGGASNKEIADNLFIAVGTVKNHVTNILGKLGVRDRTQAALKARDIGLI